MNAAPGPSSPVTSPVVKPLRLAVLTISDTRTLADDHSGNYLVETLRSAGHQVTERLIERDDLLHVRAHFARLIADPAIDVVLATGGTGFTARDITPDALAPLVTKAIDGFGELFRHLSYHEIGASTIQSRAYGALCHHTLIFLLPGSTGACRTALEKILLPQLDSRTRPCNFVELLPRIKGE